MTPRQATFVLAATFALAGIINVLAYGIYRSARNAVAYALGEKLEALGHSTARWMADVSDTGMRMLADEHHLEDAYLVDAHGRVLAGAHLQAGVHLGSDRFDPQRWQRAFDGWPGMAGSAPGAEKTQALFAVDRPGIRAVLVLEAGTAYRAPERVLRTVWLGGVAVSIALVVVFFGALRRALSALERARVEHGRAERLAALGQMAAMVAHEVRNPLGILRAQVEIAREKSSAMSRERLDDMLAEIDRINRVTEEFLALGRDPGEPKPPSSALDGAPLHLVDCDARAVIEGAIERAKMAPPIREAQLDVAPFEGPLPVRVDEAKLRQVLFNLLLNAAQVGGPGVKIHVEAGREASGVLVRVRDEGPGVPAELRGHIFEAFVSARPGGSGLGLLTARHIIERHGGRLELEESVRGASFAIHLPPLGEVA
jgi:signal transduction histidine kinase